MQSPGWVWLLRPLPGSLFRNEGRGGSGPPLRLEALQSCSRMKAKRKSYVESRREARFLRSPLARAARPGGRTRAPRTFACELRACHDFEALAPRRRAFLLLGQEDRRRRSQSDAPARNLRRSVG